MCFWNNFYSSVSDKSVTSVEVTSNGQTRWTSARSIPGRVSNVIFLENHDSNENMLFRVIRFVFSQIDRTVARATEHLVHVRFYRPFTFLFSRTRPPGPSIPSRRAHSTEWFIVNQRYHLFQIVDDHPEIIPLPITRFRSHARNIPRLDANRLTPIRINSRGSR